MNERVKELRKALGLSGEKFGESLGVKSPAIYKLENGTTKLTDQMIKLICLTYNVNENWLRTGEGQMFIEYKDSFLADLKKEYNLTDFQIELVKSYLELTDEEQSLINKFIASCAKHTDDKEI